MENVCTLELQKNCSKTVAGEKVQGKGKDMCQFQKALFRNEKEQNETKSRHKHSQIACTIKKN